MAPIVTSLATLINQFGIAAVTGPSGGGGITASGGVISDYEVSGTYYRSHIFTSSGTFIVSSGSGSIEYLVVGGGGGGGGGWYAGGGGAGGLRTNLPGVVDSNANPLSISSSYPVSTSPGSYSVTIGSGGAGSDNTELRGTDGGFSQFGPPTGTFVYGSGGGGGGSRGTPVNPGNPGGSGGGAGQNGSGTAPGGTSVASPDGLSPTTQGKSGGSNPVSNYGAGGGGAGAVGNTGGSSNPTYGASGGGGVQVLIAGPPATTQPVGTPGPSPGGGHFGGGGGAGTDTNTSYTGGFGGGGKGAINSPSTASVSGTYATGGGGGGATGFESPSASTNPLQVGANGGSGIVVVRYTLPTSSGTAKATGGSISFYGGKTIHTFTNSGTFTAPTSFNESVEYVVIGGGGSGARGWNQEYGSSGAGAGAYRTNTVTLNNSGGGSPLVCPVSIGAGGAGIGGPGNSVVDGNPGTQTTLSFPTSITSPGGGRGSYPTTGGGRANGPGGSGGGASGRNPGVAGSPATGSPFPGTIGATPTSGWGHPGGPSAPASDNAGGGGGGAGGNGGPTGPGSGNGGPGGVGIQLPATFRNPTSTVGAPGPSSPPVSGADTSGKYYVAGGGGGFGYVTAGSGGAGGGGSAVATVGPTYGIGGSGLENTGSGGAAGGAGGSTGYASGSGGSGIVLIAYPT